MPNHIYSLLARGPPNTYAWTVDKIALGGEESVRRHVHVFLIAQGLEELRLIGARTLQRLGSDDPRDAIGAHLALRAGDEIPDAALEDDAQRIEPSADRPIATLVLKESAPREYSIAVPADVLQEKNVLILGLPNAESPATFGLSKDNRLLAINGQWLEIDSSAASKNSQP